MTPLLTLRQAAETLQVSIRSVRRPLGSGVPHGSGHRLRLTAGQHGDRMESPNIL